jgi:3-oxoacyl-[acyl-carrier-protein] synthase III
MKARLESVGAYTPDRVVTTAELMNRMEHELPFPIDLEKITGIKTRRWRSEEETSYSVVLNAARECLKNSRYGPEDLDIIISTSITRSVEPGLFYLDPCMSYFVKKELGASSARHFDINNACAGMLTGAYLLENMIRAGVVKNGMVMSGEIITPIADTALREITEPFSEQFASLTVGDAGAAIIMDQATEEEDSIDFMDFVTLAEYAHLCIGRPSDQSDGVAMFTKSKEMHGARVYELGVDFVKSALDKNGIVEIDYDYIITHQVAVSTTMAALKAISQRYNIPQVQTLTTVEDYGNTASTSLFLVLYNALKEKKVHRGSKLLLIALASGLGIGLLSLKLGTMEA